MITKERNLITKIWKIQNINTMTFLFEKILKINSYNKLKILKKRYNQLFNLEVFLAFLTPFYTKIVPLLYLQIVQFDHFKGRKRLNFKQRIRLVY